eukprot:1717967-Amphidinium_carterae.1
MTRVMPLQTKTAVDCSMAEKILSLSLPQKVLNDVRSGHALSVASVHNYGGLQLLKWVEALSTEPCADTIKC